MRKTNFVEPVRARPMPLAIVIWMIAAGLFALAGWAFNEARAERDTADRFREHVTRLGSELSEIGSSDISVPSEEAFAALAVKVERLNRLTGSRHVALPVLLEAMEGALPPEVWVSQMTYSVETGAFTVSLLGEVETDLPLALRRIEAIGELTEVILERQVRVQTGTRNLLQYDIRASAE